MKTSSLRHRYVVVLNLTVLALCLSHGQAFSKGRRMPSQEEHQNRLIHEKSPYLLQHAHNPVDWYPWGEEAFAKARAEDKPVFLSIGYSTCHWCHVMEQESFEDPQMARLINEYFVPVKVDREERPDIDKTYMAAVMALTGSGGWPLTVMITPDKQPFFGGTYFPPVAKWGASGLADILRSVHDAWTNRREQLIHSGMSLTDMLLQESVTTSGEKKRLDTTVFDLAYRQFAGLYDPEYGGFGRSPKFPSGHNLSFLLRYWKRAGEPQALAMVEHTLQQMARGGMYDHLGGGFHRYSTDQEWQVPHFEKMLYDQAVLARAYLEAYQITKDASYAQVAREVFDYVLRDMSQGQGGFFSAEDADSLEPGQAVETAPGRTGAREKKEGAFYVWRQEEIVDALGREDAEVFNYHFGIQESGNAHTDPHGEFTGKNIIFIENSLDETAKRFKIPVDDVRGILTRTKKKLFDLRETRPRPHLDDKVLVDWNGLMISSLAFGGRVLKEPRYTQAAERAARFILENLVDKKGRLLHRYRDGDAAIQGNLEDYAFFIHGLLDLYEGTFQVEYLSRALRLADDMLRFFWDEQRGGFYFTAHDAEKILFRQKDVYDGAFPSGNSIAALDLVRLSYLTARGLWGEKLEALFDAFAAQVAPQPGHYAQMLTAFDFASGAAREIVLAVAPGEKNLEVMVDEVYGRFMPNKVVLSRPPDGPGLNEMVTLAPFIKDQPDIDGQTTVYVCENHRCQCPVHDPVKLRDLFEALDEKDSMRVLK